MRNLQVNGERLWASLMELAQIGATEKGGVCRLAASDLDGEARRLFIRWCEEAGCTVTVDRIGNIFARRPGRNPTLAPVMTGSHLDTQPTGGQFDGAYGVMAGLEIVRTLNDLGYETEAPIEIVAWTNEEGSRFSPAMVGSGVFAGVFDLAYGLERPDKSTGVTLGAELERIGFAGPEPVGGHQVAAYFEAHIEQGPILEAAREADRRRHRRAGPALVRDHRHRPGGACRADADAAAARRAGRRRADDRRGQPDRPCPRALCLRHGRLCPGQPQFAQHDPRPGVLHRRFPPSRRRGADRDGPRAARGLRRCRGGQRWARGRGQGVLVFPADPVRSRSWSPRCATRREAQGYPHQDIISGAGHDAVYMARVAPTAMVFVPCVGGISHNEIEDAKPEDLTAGCTVLLNALLESADASHGIG